MSSLDWLIGEQIPLRLAEVSSHLPIHYDALAALTDCDRNYSLSESLSKAHNKHALLFSAYNNLSVNRCQQARDAKWRIVETDHRKNGTFIKKLKEILSLTTEANRELVIDITGIPIPALGMMNRVLNKFPRLKTRWLYAEPKLYTNRRDTSFATRLQSIKPIQGYSGPSRFKDEGVLIMFTGYDSEAIRATFGLLKGARPRHIVLPFPPLQAQMYQESILKFQSVSEQVGIISDNTLQRHRIPAFDAHGVPSFLTKLIKQIPRKHISIAPLSTKAHALGVFFWWSFLKPMERRRVQIFYPDYLNMNPRVSEGIGRIWSYKLYRKEQEPDDCQGD